MWSEIIAFGGAGGCSVKRWNIEVKFAVPVIPKYLGVLAVAWGNCKSIEFHVLLIWRMGLNFCPLHYLCFGILWEL